MADYCKNCGGLLGVGNIYCVNCGTPIAIQIDDDGPETVVRPLHTSKAGLFAGLSVGAVAAIILGMIGIAAVSVLAAVVWMANRNQPSSVPPAPQPNPQNVYVGRTPSPVPTPTATATRRPTPPPTPEATRRNDDNGLPANEVGNAVNANLDQRRYPPFDRDGKPLRAICKDGSPSYWQADAWATCLMKGGVRQWIRR